MRQVVKTTRRAVGRCAREIALYPRLLRKSDRRRALLFAAGSKTSATLLRTYNIAEALRDLGWDSLVVPAHLALKQRQRVVGFYQPDVIVFQTCRHELNRVDLFDQYKIVLDLDDADFFDPRQTDPLIDTAKRAKGVIGGSRFICDWASSFNSNVEVIWTGTPISNGPWPDHKNRKKIVTWAQSDPVTYGDEFEFVKTCIIEAKSRGEDFKLRLYGWRYADNHPSLAPLRAAGVELELLPLLEYDDFLRSLQDVAVGLSPLQVEVSDFSKGKSFGKILAYLDAKVPIICSDAADHADFFTPETGIVSNSSEVWVREIGALLNDPNRRQKMSDAAHQAMRAQLSTQASAQKVSAFLARIVDE